MLAVYRSNSQTKLIKKLSALLTENENPLQPNWILIRNYGISKWAQSQITQTNGICANLKFIFPQQFIQQIIDSIFANEKEFLVNDADWHWKITELLLIFSNTDNYLNKYLANNNPEELYYLAITLADIFQQYSLFYPNIFNEQKELPEQYAIQKEFWQQLFYEKQYNNISNLKDRLSQLKANDFAKLPFKKVFIFGISYLSEIYINIFSILSNFIDFHFFHRVTTKEYSGKSLTAKELAKKKIIHSQDQDFTDLHYFQGHPLYMSWGRKESEFQTILLDNNWDDKLVYEDYQLSDSNFLLGKIQNSILNFDDVEKWEYAPSDTSVIISNCHNLRREVEELYNYLLKIIEANPDLNTGDILVKSPKIEKYAPYIQQVFTNSEYPLPYSILDYTPNELEWQHYLLKLVELPSQKFELDAVLDLLNCVEIQKKFNLESNELENLLRIIKNTPIKWGRNLLDIQQTEKFSKDGFSWEYGLSQLLTSCFLENDNIQLSSQNYLSLGKFITFFKLILKITDDLNGYLKPQNIAEWQTSLKFILSNFFEIDDNNVWKITNLLHRLDQAKKQIDSKLKIKYQVIFSYLSNFFTEQADKKQAKRFLEAGITFCNIQPMRSIPFKVICLLGLNEDTFPKKQRLSDLNLLDWLKHKQSKIRLPDHKSEELYIFLETIMSATKCLYLSFIGWNMKDNKQLSSSLALILLIQFLVEKLSLASPEELPFFKQHFLYGFDSRYFNKKTASYSQYFYQLAKIEQLNYKTKKSQSTTNNLSAIKPPKTIFIENFIRFFVSPLNYYCKNVLKLNPPNRVTAEEKYDFYQLTPLKFYQLAQDWIKLKIKNYSNEQILEKFYATNDLPPAPLGEKYWLQCQPLLEEWAEQIFKITKNQPPEQQTFQKDLSGITFYGGYPIYQNNSFIGYEPGKFKLKRQLAFWITHLFLCWQQVRLQPKSYWVSLDKKNSKISVNEFKFVNQAEEYLKDLLVIYQEGCKQPLAFDSEVAEKFILNQKNKSDKITKTGSYFWDLCFKEEDMTNQANDLLQRILPNSSISQWQDVIKC